MRKRVVLVGFVLATMILVGCGNDAVKNYIDKSKSTMEAKEYDKALVAIQLALDEDKDNVEANKIFKIISIYEETKTLLANNNVILAKEELEKLEDDYTNYSIKDDIEILRKDIDDKLKVVEEINSKLDNISKLIDEKGYSEAKALFLEVSKESLSEEQKNKANELNAKIDFELVKIDAQKKAEEQARIEEEKRKNTITRGKAVELVKSYLKNKGESLPPILEVDAESDKEFTVHGYADMGTHTATSGWYYVNKNTGNVTSMFDF